jgi:putative phosphoribosyl transferase
VAATDCLAALRPLVDELVCVIAPEPFYAIGLWYEDFAPTSDAEVCALLEHAAWPAVAAAAGRDDPRIAPDDITLNPAAKTARQAVDEHCVDR